MFHSDSIVENSALLQMGDDCMVLPTVPEENIDTLFPQGVTVVPLPSGKKYLKKTPCPDV